MKTALAILFSFAAAPAAAEDFLLEPPLECGPAKATPCIIQQFVDTDPSDGSADFQCGTLSYDGHKGTDFRLPTQSQMHEGVSVVASAAGRVKATRDGMQDIIITDPDAPNVSGKECGNGVLIDHGNGWETQYCHLKAGSVSVARGDQVNAGDRLGLVGLSGKTAFPHVHLSVRKDGNVVDPFDPSGTESCGSVSDDLWNDQNQPGYRAGGILDAGFHDAVPEFQDLKQGSIGPVTLAHDAPALVIWVYLFGSQTDDVIRFNINGPEGWSFNSNVTLDRPQAELFRAAGKRRPKTGWPKGTYSGTVQWHREGAVYQTRTVTLEITG